ncbi:MAG TPA: hypothetical protein DCX22_01375 [Dehalococcoidia bacterium]|nr:hypothetical protein [Dehalococcoidia bacterium]
MATSVFLDTNLLIYAINEDSPWHSAAVALIDKINTGEVQACLSPQVLAEFYATVTNSKKVKHALTADEAVATVDGYIDSDILKLYPGEGTMKHTYEIAQRYRTKGLDIYDAQIVALMLENDVTTIYTANLSDFKRFKDIVAVNPLE